MALANVALNIYGQVENFFDTIKLGQAPDKFTQQHLKDMGYSSTNFRAFIPLLKSLGFLSSEGVPTPRYHEYRNDALSRKIMGTALKEAYSDIFILRTSPQVEDEPLIQGKFKSTFNASDANSKKMMKTFYSLLAIADLEGSLQRLHTEPKKMIKPEPAKEIHKEIHKEIPKEIVKSENDLIKRNNYPSLNYNIQIHLPATKDVEVYNAIFKSIKEHLID